MSLCPWETLNVNFPTNTLSGVKDKQERLFHNYIYQSKKSGHGTGGITKMGLSNYLMFKIYEVVPKDKRIKDTTTQPTTAKCRPT